MRAILTMTSMLALLAVGCAPPQPDPPVNPGICGDHEFDEIELGLKITSELGNFEFELMKMLPLEPGEGFNNWDLSVVDLREAGDGVRDDLVLSFQPYMPDHDHGPAATTGTFEDGLYLTGNMDFFMPGYWQVTVDIDDGTESPDTLFYDLCIE
jgi:hypothetical protein